MLMWLSVTSSLGRRNGKGRSMAASTALNIAVVAPMPSARMPTTEAVNPGRCRNRRAA